MFGRDENRAEGKLSLSICNDEDHPWRKKMKQRRGVLPMRSTPLLYEVKNEFGIQVVEK